MVSSNPEHRWCFVSVVFIGNVFCLCGVHRWCVVFIGDVFCVCVVFIGGVLYVCVCARARAGACGVHRWCVLCVCVCVCVCGSLIRTSTIFIIIHSYPILFCIIIQIYNFKRNYLFLYYGVIVTHLNNVYSCMKNIFLKMTGLLA